MKSRSCILSVIFCVLMGSFSVLPCTTFVLKDKGLIYFGRNLNWDWDDGLIILNPRNIKKSALVAEGHTPAKWTSKYGSVTFNQFGLERPFGGMNEAGLVVEQMMLFDSQYPAADSRPEIDMLQWIQYQLDNCSTVAEVINSDSKIRLEQPTVPARIHYLISDAAGDAVTIEFLGGKMVCHRGQNMPYRALANSTYEQSVAFARTNAALAPASAQLKEKSSLMRFAYAASRAAAFKSGSPEANVAYAFETLEHVRQGKGTVWQIVYDVTGRQIFYRTASNPEQAVLDLNAMDFAIMRTAIFTALPAKAPIGMAKFSNLTEAKHREYLKNFYAQDSLKQAMGDLAPMIEPHLLALRDYAYVDTKSP